MLARPDTSTRASLAMRVMFCMATAALPSPLLARATRALSEAQPSARPDSFLHGQRARCGVAHACQVTAQVLHAGAGGQAVSTSAANWPTLRPAACSSALLLAVQAQDDFYGAVRHALPAFTACHCCRCPVRAGGRADAVWRRLALGRAGGLAGWGLYCAARRAALVNPAD